MFIIFARNSPVDHAQKEDVQSNGSNCQLLAILDKGEIVWVAVPSSPMETVQVVVPYERDSGENHRGQWQVGQGESKEYIEVIFSIGVRHPGEDKDLDDVKDNGEEPRKDSPTGQEAAECRMEVVVVGAQALELDRI